jgi:hypothetical protein
MDDTVFLKYQKSSLNPDDLQMIMDDLNQRLDLFHGKFAVFSEDQFPFFIKGGNITALVGNLPGTHQHSVVIPYINGFGITLLFIFNGRRNSKIGKPGGCHVNNPNRLKLIAGKLPVVKKLEDACLEAMAGAIWLCISQDEKC